jgi:transcriptional regulator with XRE-family HTH domain
MREKRGLTQAELAEKSGVNMRMLQHYEQGFKDINGAKVVTVLRIADALDCDIREILNA